jgi:hypothetical protein
MNTRTVVHLTILTILLFLAHTVAEYMYYKQCRSNFAMILLFKHTRTCLVAQRVIGLLENSLWCYAIVFVKEINYVYKLLKQC